MRYFPELYIIGFHLTIYEYIELQCALLNDLRTKQTATLLSFKESVDKNKGTNDISAFIVLNFRIDDDFVLYLLKEKQTCFLKQIPTKPNYLTYQVLLQLQQNRYFRDEIPYEIILYLYKLCKLFNNS